MEQDVMQINEQYVAFKLSNEIYAVDIRVVKTVEKILPITRVPKTDKSIMGVTNLRGEIVPIIDLRIKFDMDVKYYDDDTRIMFLISENSQMVGVIVDSVDEVLKIPYNSIQNSSNVSSSVDSNCIYGISKVGEKVVTVLNTEQLILTEEE